MDTSSIAGPAENPGNAPALPPNSNANLKFIDFATLAERVPLCERSLREAIRRGRIPSIRLPGARRVMFCWDSVQSALLRLERSAE